MLVVSGYVNAQDMGFKFDKSGLTDYIITETPNKTKAEIYEKVVNWIKTTYKNPSAVIVAEIKDDYVKINGAALGLTGSGKNTYVIEISIKDGKYKLDVVELKYYITPNQFRGGWYDYNLGEDVGNEHYKKNGEVTRFHKIAVTEVPKYFNELNKSLFDYINSNEITNSKKEW